MSDMKDRFEKWRRETKKTLDSIDGQLGLSDRLEEGARTVVETAQKGAERIKAEAERSDLGKQAVKAAETAVSAAGDTAKKAWSASEPIRDAVEDVGEAAGSVAKDAVNAAGEAAWAAGKKAGSIIDDAGETVTAGAKKVSQAFSLGAGWTRTFDSASKTLSQTVNWISEDPLRAAATGASIAVGAGLGAVFTGISSHWLFNSALPAWSVKKLSEQFTGYLRSQNELIEKGALSEAEAERVKFERDIVKRIGAPLLGAFSLASGAVMMTNILNPKEVTGAPISWLLGGNPMFESVWFFANGIVCFKVGYDCFMIALEDHDEVHRMVREIKGLLPA